MPLAAHRPRRHAPQHVSLWVATAVLATLAGCGATQTSPHHAPGGSATVAPPVATPLPSPRPAPMWRHSRSRPVPDGRMATTPARPTPVPRPTAVSRPERAHRAIVVYGSGRCGICKGFRARMARAGIRYTWVDINHDPQGRRAMWRLVQQAKPGARSVRFPVITLGRRTLVSPRYADFERAMAQR